MILLVAGVSGSGKTTIGALLAGRLHWRFADGDAFHPAANIAKMRAGIPLTDEDRRPWLRAIAAWMDERIAKGESAVITCSALKRAYRDTLRQADPGIWFLHLVLDRQTAAARVAGRPAHFMPASLVDSQFADLEPLGPGEPGLAVDATLPPAAIIATVLDVMSPRR